MNTIGSAYNSLTTERDELRHRLALVDAAIRAIEPLLADGIAKTPERPVADREKLASRMPKGRALPPGYVDKTAAGPSLSDVIARGARRTYGVPVEDLPPAVDIPPVVAEPHDAAIPKRVLEGSELGALAGSRGAVASSSSRSAAVQVREQAILRIMRANGNVATFREVKARMPREQGQSDEQREDAVRNTMQRMKNNGVLGRTGQTWSIKERG